MQYFLNTDEIGLLTTPYEYLLDTVGRAGKPMAKIVYVGNIFEITFRSRFPALPSPRITPVRSLPTDFQTIIVLNVQVVVVHIGELMRKKEYRRTLRVEDAGDGTEADITVWAGHATREYAIGETLLMQRVEASCQLGRPMQLNAWYTAMIIPAAGYASGSGTPL